MISSVSSQSGCVGNGGQAKSFYGSKHRLQTHATKQDRTSPGVSPDFEACCFVSVPPRSKIQRVLSGELSNRHLGYNDRKCSENPKTE